MATYTARIINKRSALAVVGTHTVGMMFSLLLVKAEDKVIITTKLYSSSKYKQNDNALQV